MTNWKILSQVENIIALGALIKIKKLAHILSG